MSQNMKQVALVGAGQLGLRHLQGLVRSIEPLTIHIVDPSHQSRMHAKEFVAQLGLDDLHQFNIHEVVNGLPSELDLAIVATTANHRLNAMKELASEARVTHMILEKFLFNDSEDYVSAAQLIEKHGFKAWVNTPRRHFNVYREIKESNRGRKLLKFSVEGGDWGLCCNSVHFIDLAQFLAGLTKVSELNSRFDQGILASRRSGYIELTGELNGSIGSTKFYLKSIRGGAEPISIFLQYEHQTIFISESEGVLRIEWQGGKVERNFTIPYQSEMTGVIAGQLFTTGICDLTPYSDSRDAHVPLLQAFAKQAGKATETRVQCAIT